MNKPLFNAPIPTQQASGASPMAGAISNLGGALKKVEGLASKLQDEQQRQILAESEIKMKKSSYELQDKLRAEYDPTKHLQIAQEHMDKLQNDIMSNDKLTVGFQNNLDDRLKAFTESKLLAVESDAKMKQVDNGRRLQIARANMYQDEGDYEAAEAVLDEGVGVYWPAEYAEEGRMKMKTAQKNAEWNTLVNENPVEAVKQLKDKDENGDYINGGISPDRRRILTNKANTAIQQYRRAEIAEWERKIEDGVSDIDALTELKKENSYLTSKDISSLRKKALRDRDPTIEEIEQGYDLIKEFVDYSNSGVSRAKVDARYTELEVELSAMYQTGQENSLLKTLKDFSPDKQLNRNRENLNTRADLLVTEYKADGYFGDKSSVDAKIAASDLRIELAEYISSNPRATMDDLKGLVQRKVEVSASVKKLDNSKVSRNPNLRSTEYRNRPKKTLENNSLSPLERIKESQEVIRTYLNK